MKRFLPFLLIVGVLLLALGAGAVVYRSHRPPVGPRAVAGNPGAEPAHVRGNPKAPASLEVFGDFECMPCYMIWPALRNLEKDYADRLSVTFRESPLPQHLHALEGARAAEAAGLQGKFWEMHDLLYLHRREWLRSANIPAALRDLAGRLQLDVARFERDMQSEEVQKRLTADLERSHSLSIDRTPALFLNGLRLELQGDVENGIKADIEQALGKSAGRAEAPKSPTGNGSK